MVCMLNNVLKVLKRMVLGEESVVVVDIVLCFSFRGWVDFICD